MSAITDDKYCDLAIKITKDVLKSFSRSKFIVSQIDHIALKISLSPQRRRLDRGADAIFKHEESLTIQMQNTAKMEEQSLSRITEIWDRMAEQISPKDHNLAGVLYIVQLDLVAQKVNKAQDVESFYFGGEIY